MSNNDLFEIPKETNKPDDYYNQDVALQTAINEAVTLYNASEERHKSENPSSAKDVSSLTLGLMFGDNWNGEYYDITPVVSRAAVELASQMKMYGSMAEWLDGQKDTIVNNVYVNSGLRQLNQAMESTKGSFDSIASTISNFGDYSDFGASSILNNADNILANMEKSAETLIDITDKVGGVISYLEENDIVGNAATVIEEQYDRITGMLDADNLENLLSTFPQAVIDKFMQADFIQDLLVIPQQLYKKLLNIQTILASVKAPTNLSSVLATIKLLRMVVAEMKDAENIIMRGVKAINDLKNDIKNGNYIGIFQKATSSCKFVEKTSCFAAQYPYNQAYETEGGHIFETDNTPGHERLHIQHRTGTDVEIAPNGDMVSKIKNDCQFVVEKDFQTHVKGNQLLLVDDTSEVESESMKMTAKEDLSISAKTTTYTTDTLNILADDTMLTNGNTLTIATNVSSSISSVGPLFLTSESQIVIDAPSIIIGMGRTQLLNINSTNVIVNSFTTFIGEGVIKLKGLITLN